MQKKKAIVLTAAVAIAVFAIALIANQTTGFLTLQNQKAESGQEVSASLSVQEVKETSLNARLLEAETKPCPAFKDLSFEVSNSGSSIAERLFVKPSGNLKVIECINCNAKQLSVGEKITVRLKACKTNNEKASVSFSSINAVEERIEVQ
jgi:hypothetical protein